MSDSQCIRQLRIRQKFALAAILVGCAPALAQGIAQPVPIPANRTPLDLVDALHAAFGEHHARTVHTKVSLTEGQFAPAAEARAA